MRFIVKVKEDLKVNEYYDRICFVEEMNEYKGKIFEIEFIRRHPYDDDNSIIINLKGIHDYNFSMDMLDLIYVEG